LGKAAAPFLRRDRLRRLMRSGAPSDPESAHSSHATKLIRPFGVCVSTIPTFDLSVIAEHAHARVCPRGEIDLATAGLLDAQIDELWASGWTDVVVDLREVTFLDSSGLHVLLAHHRRAAERGGRFSIIDGGGPVSRVLALTGMDAVFDHAPSEAVR